jgi:cytochrome c-type biogenesis protein CcmH/NrfG
MKTIKNISTIAVLVASVMFSFANGQVEENYRKQLMKADETIDQYQKRIEELEAQQFEACLEASRMIDKRQELLMVQEARKMTSATQFTMNAQIFTAWLTYYQTFCKD